MDRFETMTAAAGKAMKHVLDLKPEDRVLVVMDEGTRSCGDAFARAAERLGCPVATFLLPETERPLQSVPAALLADLQDVDVVINAVIGDDREVAFRIAWIQAIEENGTIRLGHSPGIDEDMMIGGPLDVDYELMDKQAAELFAAFAEVDSVHITAPGGTDLNLDLRGRRFISDLKATPEAGCNLPCGEIYCCPVETGADGVLVVDGCFGAYGNVPSPVRITVAAGRATEVMADDEGVVTAINALLDTDDGSRTIAELGIGLNPGARLTDRMLEAEKVGGTAHVAFGSNEGMPGGQSISKMHMDYLFKQPTMEVTLGDGSRRVVMKEGRVVSG